MGTEENVWPACQRNQGKSDLEQSWTWIWKSDLKVETEALIFAAQEQVLRTNYLKFHIDKTGESLPCRMCNEKGESVNHVISECKKLAQTDYRDTTTLQESFTGNCVRRIK